MINRRISAPMALLLGGILLAPFTVQAASPEDGSVDGAGRLDLTIFLQSRSDARSQSFQFNGWQEHAFTVERAGRYLIGNETLASLDANYRIEAELLDADGEVVMRREAFGNDGGLAMRPELEPGDYTLRVNAHEFGKTARRGNRYVVTVSGLDAQGRKLQGNDSGIDAGGGVLFDRNQEGPGTAMVRNATATAALAAPEASKPSSASDAQARDTTAETPSQAEAEPAEEPTFKEVVTDVEIFTEGEVMSFQVMQAGTVAVTTSTMMGTEGTYRIQARVLDADGRVVASDEGTRFDGDVELETHLAPGRYTVWVKGQKYGHSPDAANNYALRVRQLSVD